MTTLPADTATGTLSLNSPGCQQSPLAARHWVPSNRPEKLAAAEAEKRQLRQQAGLSPSEIQRQGGISLGLEGGAPRLTRAFLNATVYVYVDEPLKWD